MSGEERVKQRSFVGELQIVGFLRKKRYSDFLTIYT